MASSSTSWDDAVEVDHPEFLASLSAPTAGHTADTATVQAEPHATTEGTTAPSVVAGGRHPFLSAELSAHVDQLVGLYP